MPNFGYIALDAQGKEVRGKVEANDLHAARETLRGRALMPVKLGFDGSGSGVSGQFAMSSLNPFRLLPVSSRDKQFLFRQLALMVKSGHRLRASLELLESISSKRALVSALKRMIAGIDRGESFAEALRNEGKLFPRYVPALIEAGERSGTLDRVLDQVASSMERARELKNTLVRALLMPSITMIVAFGVLAFVVLWLVPKLTTFLMRGGGDIHWTMQMLVSTNEFFLDYGLVILLVLGTTAFVLAAAYTTLKGRQVLDLVWMYLPIFGRTTILFEMSRFGSIGMLLIRSGLRQVEALRVLAQVTQNQALRDMYNSAADQLLEGKSMTEALDSPIFDTMARHMVGVGESSGSLDEVLDHIGIYYTDEVETRIQVIFSTLVPALTLAVGFVVAVIYLSVILTILGAVNSIR